MIPLNSFNNAAWDFVIRRRFAHKSNPSTPCWVLTVEGVGQVGSVYQTYHDFIEETELVGTDGSSQKLRRKYPR